MPETPFELAVEVKIDDESGAAGLVWAADGGDRHYGFYPSAGQMRLTRFDGANVFSWTILDQRLTRHYLPGDWNRLKVRNEGNRFYCYVNGNLIFESSDRGLSGGRAGLAKFRNTVASFRNFQLGTKVQDDSTPIAPSLSQALISESNLGADLLKRLLPERVKIRQAPCSISTPKPSDWNKKRLNCGSRRSNFTAASSGINWPHCLRQMKRVLTCFRHPC